MAQEGAKSPQEYSRLCYAAATTKFSPVVNVSCVELGSILVRSVGECGLIRGACVIRVSPKSWVGLHLHVAMESIDSGAMSILEQNYRKDE